MYNEHVYKYYRWIGWCKGSTWGGFFNYEFAKEEREVQESWLER
jgi:hypothetical protein